MKQFNNITITNLLFFLFLTIAFAQQSSENLLYNKTIKVGAERTDLYLPLLKGKSIAIIANQSSLIGNTHLVDSLLAIGVDIRKVFSPEHGFRGDADAGEHVKDYQDKKTGLPVISLYGKNIKPKSSELKDIDIMVFDIQDVGVRFYTYISTMHYSMESCAENNVQFLVLDRPNPNGFYVDGPVMEEKYRSFSGLHPVPVIHGMTMAEYARMINGQGWLKNSVKCELFHILCEGYTHKDHYQLPVKPSPNLPNMVSVYLYPTLGLFEGTVISVGRGTDMPFQVVGHPDMQKTNPPSSNEVNTSRTDGREGMYTFTPRSIPGASKNPPYKGVKCYGYDLSMFGKVFIKNYKKIYLYWLTSAYESIPDKENFFNDYFDNLTGSSTMRQQIIDGVSEMEIRKTWQKDLEKFKVIRKGYLLYPDFE
ncbi:MAG: DUF1343 domain-containing protein [Bacteroidota bacterium]